MLLSPTIKYKDRYNGYTVEGYALDLKQQMVTIFFGRYWVEAGQPSEYVDTVGHTLTPDETIERMMTVVNGKNLFDELGPWAEGIGVAAGIIPADAVLVE